MHSLHEPNISSTSITTATSIATASSSIPSSPSALPTIIPGYVPSFDQLLALARLPHLQHFFLRNHFDSEINTLCASTSLDAAWCSRIEFTSTSVSLDEPPMTTCKYFDVMLAPAHATGCITAGPAAITHADGRLDIGRFARDDSDGSTIIVLNSSHNPHIDVISIVHDGAMRLRRTHVRFRSVHYFRLVLLKEEGVALNTAIIRSESMMECRACPMCQRTGERPCSCRLAFISPMHSTDFAPFRANLHALTGAYSGHCLKFHFSDSSPCELLIRTCVTPTSSQRVISNLAHSAAQYLLASATKSNVAIPSTQTSLPVTTTTTTTSYPFSSISVPPPLPALEETTVPKQLTFAESVENIIQQSLTTDQLQYDERAVEHDALVAFLSGTPNTTSAAASPPPPPTRPTTRTTTTPPSIQVANSMMDAVATTAAHQTSPISQMSEQDCTWQVLDITRGLEGGIGTRVERTSRVYQEQRGRVSPTTSSVSTPTVEKEIRKPTIRRARRTTKKVVTEEMLREREARRQLRIFKNRQAAARSNQRRKMQNDRLKSALAEARGRALQLRDRHMVLREENLRLKMALLM